MTHASQQEEAEEEQGGEQEVGLEQAEETEHLADEKLANATTFFYTFTFSNVLLFDHHFRFQPFCQCEPDDEPSWFETVAKL